MFKLFIALLFVPLLTLFNKDETNIEAISKAIRTGNADSLGQYFNDIIDITILDKEDVYSKKDAVKLIKDFFTAHKPGSFKIINQQAAKEDAKLIYCVGDMIAGSISYRIHLFIKLKEGKGLISEMQIEK